MANRRISEAEKISRLLKGTLRDLYFRRANDRKEGKTDPVPHISREEKDAVTFLLHAYEVFLKQSKEEGSDKELKGELTPEQIDELWKTVGPKEKDAE